MLDFFGLILFHDFWSTSGVLGIFSGIYQELTKKDRDEAIGAKAIAEKKIVVDKDFAGAKKYILKARSLDPELVGISQMLTTVNVYISSEKKVNGEADWYGVLDINPFDDEETIKKQHKKLARMVHPHKNKSVGANGAFKIVSEAWNLLSDKDKRMAYDQRRYRTPVVHGSAMFWTVCGQCKMHHECSRVDVNRTLLCPNCHKVFRAREIFRDPLIMSLEN